MAYVDSNIFKNFIAKHDSTTEKPLQIDVYGIHESYETCELAGIR